MDEVPEEIFLSSDKTGMELRQEISRVILSNTRGKERPKRIMLASHTYKAFEDAVRKSYRDIFGGFVSDEWAAMCGYKNIRYLGLPICLGEDPH